MTIKVTLKSGKVREFKKIEQIQDIYGKLILHENFSRTVHPDSHAFHQSEISEVFVYLEDDEALSLEPKNG